MTTYTIYKTSSIFSSTSKDESPAPEAYEVRDSFGNVSWEINITSLEQLQELVSNVGKIVLHPTEIEIYDTYRE